jgi:hypothetical protein
MEDSEDWLTSCLDTERGISMGLLVNKDRKEVYGQVFC